MACSLVISTDGLTGGSLADGPNDGGDSGSAAAGPDGSRPSLLEPPSCPDFHGMSAISPWPALSGCPSRAGRTAIVGPASPAKAKAFAHVPFDNPKGDESYSDPTIGADGSIYIGVEDALGVRAFNGDGSVRWSGSQDSCDALGIGSDGDVYAASGTGLARVDPATGKVRWRYLASAEIDSAPVIARNGDTYWADYGGHLGAVSSTGTSAWVIDAGPPQGSVPRLALGPSGLIYEAGEGFLLGVTPDGAIRWRYTLAGSTGSPVIDSAETIYVGGADGTLHAVSPTGEMRWRTNLGGGAVGSPALGRDRTLYVGTESGRLVAISVSGTVVWQWSLPSRIAGPPLLDGSDTLYVLTEEPALYARAARDGTELWRYALPARPNEGIAITSGGTLVLSLRTSAILTIER